MALGVSGASLSSPNGSSEGDLQDKTQKGHKGMEAPHTVLCQSHLYVGNADFHASPDLVAQRCTQSHLYRERNMRAFLLQI